MLLFKKNLVKKRIRLRLRDQIIVFKQLGFFLKSGATIDECISLCAARVPRTNPRKIFLDLVKEDLASGCPLWQSIQKRIVLPPGLITVIEAGEESGTIRQALERCGQTLVKKDVLRKKTMAALTYPISIALLSVVLTGGMTFGIFPKIRPLLESMHTTLPFPTRVLIFVSDTIARHWFWGIVFLVSVFLSVIFISKYTFTRTFTTRVRDRLLLTMPFVNTLIKGQILSVFTGTMAVLVSSGIPLVVGLRRSHPNNVVYAQALDHIGSTVESGTTVSQALATHAHLFPETMVQLVSAAEASGSLAETLAFLSEYFQGEYEELVKKWSSLLEPVLMVLLGCAIGFIALAMILPIYALSQTVSAIH